MVRKAALLLLLVLSTTAGAGPALADEKHAEQIEQYSRVLSSLESSDEAHRATAELGALRNRLLEARMLLRDEKPAELERVLKVIKYEVQMIKALIGLGIAEQRAAVQKADADALDETVDELQRQLELLRQRVEVLEEQARTRRVTPPASAGVVSPAAHPTGAGAATSQPGSGTTE